MGFLLRAAAVVSGGCAVAGAYVFSNRRNSKQFAQDVPAGASLAFRFQPRIEEGEKHAIQILLIVLLFSARAGQLSLL